MIREALATYAEVFRDRDGVPRRVDDRMARIYEVALADIPEPQLSAALEKAIQTSRFFPTPADIREHVTKADKAGLELEGEQAWQRLLAWIRENVSPDLGIYHGAPSLPPEIEHAARAAGGVRYLEQCSEEELGWRKKEFVRDYTTIHQTRQVEHMLSDREARKILADLAGQKAPALPKAEVENA